MVSKKLCFVYDDNFRIFAIVEFFILYEIRHIFQNLICEDYKNGFEIRVDERLVNQWIYEKEHYQKSIDGNGYENECYFKQNIEMDAYAFALGIMKYKYGDLSKLYIPKSYGKEFYDIVEQWTLNVCRAWH